MNSFPTKILAATDGSEHAVLAARAATDLSLHSGAELHVVHVWQEPRLAMTLPAIATDEYSQARERWEREAGDLLHEQADRMRDTEATVAGAHLRKGRPAEEVVSLAEELEADLVVVGSRGLGRAKRLVTGSVSEGIVHLASSPTLIVRGGEGVWPPRDVVVGDDGSQEAARAGKLAAQVGKLFEASVLLVGVYSIRLVSSPARAPMPRTFDELLNEGEDILNERAASLETVSGDRPETMVATGDAAAVIQEIAGESALVAVGSRGLGAVRRFTLGSVSTDVLRAVSGPVLVCPSPGGA
ncbi:MAG: universal stress protein [Actinomycetota bacterium]|nr:universal stress protein [Actinomycetota bacterium]